MHKRGAGKNLLMNSKYFALQLTFYPNRVIAELAIHLINKVISEVKAFPVTKEVWHHDLIHACPGHPTSLKSFV